MIDNDDDDDDDGDQKSFTMIGDDRNDEPAPTNSSPNATPMHTCVSYARERRTIKRMMRLRAIMVGDGRNDIDDMMMAGMMMTMMLNENGADADDNTAIMTYDDNLRLLTDIRELQDDAVMDW